MTTHSDNITKWFQAEDYAECERVLHKLGPAAAARAERRCIRARRAEKRAADRAEVERRQVSLALALGLVMTMLACTPLARWQSLRGLADASEAVGCIAEVAGEAWGAPLCRAAEWLSRWADQRASRLEAASEAELELDRRGEELLEAYAACDDPPTPEQEAAVVAALARCPELEGEGGL